MVGSSVTGVCYQQQQQHRWSACFDREQTRQTRRYQLTVIDILADYIRFRCESVASARPPIQPGQLLAECNRIVSSLYVIFDGCTELVTLTLLRLVPDRRHTLLLYPVFENVLTGRVETATGDSIPCYVRMLLCFKRWKSLVGGRAEKSAIDDHASRVLPARCPPVRNTSDLPFLRLLPPVPPAQRVTETRYLLVTDLFNPEHCVEQFLRHYRRAGGPPADETTAKQRDDNSIRQRRLHSMEIRSNYINVPLLAELMERKSRLWARAAYPVPADMFSPTPTLDERALHQEAHSIAESLRLIFRNRTEFIELTLLRVKSCPSFASLLVPVFDAFLGPAAASAASATYGANPSTTTGLTIYRSNDVETYGRLVLCYAKWKALLWVDGPNQSDPVDEWARIDAVALTQLPYEFPRAICRRDAALRRIFPPVVSRMRAGVVPADAKRNNTTTGLLLRTLPKRADLQELCQKFIQVYGCGSDANLPTHDQLPEVPTSPKTTSPAYKSMSAGTDRSPRHWQLDSVNVTGRPTIAQPAGATECQSEMKPIIILDSDDADEKFPATTNAEAMSTPDAEDSNHNIPARHDSVIPVSDVSYVHTGMDRNTPSTGTDEFVGDGTVPLPLNVECFLNTPPATPKQQPQQHHLPLELTPETVVPDEERRPSALVKKSCPRTPASWLRLKGTIRLKAVRKKRTHRLVAATVRRCVLTKVFADGGWWNFADVLAVKIRSPWATGLGCRASIMNAYAGWDHTPKVEQTVTNEPPKLWPAVVGGRKMAGDAEDRTSTSDDALLRELIDCLGASVESTQGYVDFTIPPDNAPGCVEDRASPSWYGDAYIDTSPLFAADSDKYVLLFTELGPVSWPIV
uniref:Uncharacterized protein n=1 Tax=Anopheles farauti TaxID=69004 RepID=A0A182QMY5_9DIPT